MEGKGVVCNGYIPGSLSCLSMRSASLVTLDYSDGVIQLGKEFDVIVGGKTINDW